MRYLVTGGAGFIGSNTVDELVRRGHSVVVLDDLSSGKEENLAEIRSKITFVKGSITDLEAVQKAIHQAEYVIHLAARTSVPRSVKDPLETNKINVEGTLNVLVAARDNKVKRVVFSASSSVYGETPTLPKSEAMQPQPISPYGVSKYAGELYAQTFGRCYGLENGVFAVLQYFWSAARPGLALLRGVIAIRRGVSGGAAAGCVRGRRANAGFHICGQRGAGKFTRVRSSQRAGGRVQCGDGHPGFLESDLGTVPTNIWEKAGSEV